eukprot:817228_1
MADQDMRLVLSSAETQLEAGLQWWLLKRELDALDTAEVQAAMLYVAQSETDDQLITGTEELDPADNAETFASLDEAPDLVEYVSDILVRMLKFGCTLMNRRAHLHADVILAFVWKFLKSVGQEHFKPEMSHLLQTICQFTSRSSEGARTLWSELEDASREENDLSKVLIVEEHLAILADFHAKQKKASMPSEFECLPVDEHFHFLMESGDLLMSMDDVPSALVEEFLNRLFDFIDPFTRFPCNTPSLWRLHFLEQCLHFSRVLGPSMNHVARSLWRIARWYYICRPNHTHVFWYARETISNLQHLSSAESVLDISSAEAVLAKAWSSAILDIEISDTFLVVAAALASDRKMHLDASFFNALCAHNYSSTVSMARDRIDFKSLKSFSNREEFERLSNVTESLAEWVVQSVSAAQTAVLEVTRVLGSKHARLSQNLAARHIIIGLTALCRACAPVCSILSTLMGVYALRVAEAYLGMEFNGESEDLEIRRLIALAQLDLATNLTNVWLRPRATSSCRESVYRR